MRLVFSNQGFVVGAAPRGHPDAEPNHVGCDAAGGFADAMILDRFRLIGQRLAGEKAGDDIGSLGLDCRKRFR